MELGIGTIILIVILAVAYVGVRDQSRSRERSDAFHDMAGRVTVDDSPMHPVIAAALGVPGARFGVWIEPKDGGRMFVAAYGTPEEAATAAPAVVATLRIAAAIG